jgi:Flp pilus assembly secretin CpaC
MKIPLWFIALAVSMMASASAQPTPATTPGPAPTPASPASELYEAERREMQRQMGAKWNVRIDVLMVAIPQDLALPLLGEFHSEDDRKVETAFIQIQEMIAKKQAKLLAWPSLVAIDGQRAVMETIVEKRYPTEFSLPPANRPKSDSKLVDHDLNSAPTESFETRNLGATLEAAATVFDDGKRIHINVVPQRVELLGWKNYKAGLKGVGIGEIEQPEFASERVTTSLILRNGARSLIAVHRLESPADHIEFFILHAQATPVK